MYPAWAQVLGALAFLFTLFIVLYGIGLGVYAMKTAGWLPKGFSLAHFVVIMTCPFLVAFVFAPIRRRLSMFRYVRWLKTYDEPIELRRRQRAWGSRCLEIGMRNLRRGYGYVLREIRAAWRYGRGEATRNEFPGEIYLE